MTALCNGGTSSAKPGMPFTVAFGSGLITEALTAINPALLPFAIFIDAFVFDVTSNCGIDPPPMPTFTLEDFTTLIANQWSFEAIAVGEKINAALHNWAWHVYCRCDNNTAIPPVVTQPAPTGYSSTGGNQVAPCFRGSTGGDVPWVDQVVPVAQLPNITPIMLPVTGPPIDIQNQGAIWSSYPISPGITSCRWNASWPLVQNSVGATAPIGTAWCRMFDASHVQTDVLQFFDVNSSSTIQKGTQSLSGRGVFACFTWGAQYPYTWPHPPGDAEFSVDWFCGVAPTALSQCCPPDPTIQNSLNQLFQAVRLLIQRTDPVGPYQDATRHDNVSGTGAFTITPGAVAVRVEFNNLPPEWHNNPGTPDYYFSVGFITPFAAGTPLKGQRIVYTHQIFDWPTYTDQIGYTLYDSLSANFIELEKTRTPA